jgi:hypothetical protein
MNKSGKGSSSPPAKNTKWDAPPAVLPFPQNSGPLRLIPSHLRLITYAQGSIWEIKV